MLWEHRFKTILVSSHLTLRNHHGFTGKSFLSWRETTEQLVSSFLLVTVQEGKAMFTGVTRKCNAGRLAMSAHNPVAKVVFRTHQTPKEPKQEKMPSCHSPGLDDPEGSTNVGYTWQPTVNRGLEVRKPSWASLQNTCFPVTRKIVGGELITGHYIQMCPFCSIVE